MSQPERDKTDASLRAERDKTDRALASEQAAASDEADSIIVRARETADAVLEAARSRADDRIAAEGSTARTADAVTRERAVEDETVRVERAEADDALARERAESRQALARLLPLERTKTDRFLWTERERSDHAISYRDDFLGIVSHDLRNLLGGIVTSADLMARMSDADPDSAVGRGATRICRYAARMNRLVGDLLDVTAIEAGQLAVTRTTADLRDVMAEAIQLFEAEASQRGISLQLLKRGNVLEAAFDHDRILQVLANLLSNALKFTATGGSVRLSADVTGGMAEVSVVDTGSGIPHGAERAVFDRFWQAEAGRTRGHGLGLYISRNIVEAHGGEIRVEAAAGGGSAFRFTLPIEQAA